MWSAWKIAERRGAVTQSHYWIRANRIEWAPKWSRQQIEAGRLSDRLAQQRHFDGARGGSAVITAWYKFKGWFKRVFLGRCL
jgi:hypothetical protein